MTVTTRRIETEGDQKVAKIRLNKRSQVTIPKVIVDKLHLVEGDALEITLDDDGRIIIEPMVSIPRSQAWFWTENWQAEERKAEEDARSGRYDVIRNPDELDAYFKKLDSESK